MRRVLMLPLALAGSLPGIASAHTEAALPEESSKSDDVILVVGQQVAVLTVEPRGLSVSLGKEEFEAVNAVNVEDLMKYTPNFFVRKRFAGDDNAVVAM